MNDELHGDFDRIREVSNAIEVARDLGLELVKKGRSWMTRCPGPGHEDEKPSCSISNLGFRCFGCGIKGDVFHLVRLVKGLPSNVEAFKWLRERAGMDGAGANGNGGGSGEAAKEEEKKTAVSAQEIESLRDEPGTWKLLTEMAVHFHKRLTECPEALEYLSMRGLYSPEVVRHFRVGFDDGSAAGALSREERDVLAKIGYLNGRGKPAFYKMIVVPLFRGEVVVGLYGRRIGDVEPTHRYLAGRHRGVVNPQAIASSSELVLAEKPIDALSAFAMGVRHVTATYGATGFPAELVEAIAKTSKILYLAQDADPGGEAGVAKSVEIFSKKGIICRRVRLPKGTKDLNELLTGYGERRAKEIFARVLEEAPPLTADGAASGKTSYEGMLSLREGQGQFHYGGTHYVVWPIPPVKKDVKLIVKAERNGGSHHHKLDLFNSDACARFAKKAGEKLDIQPARVEADLAAIYAELEALWAKKKVGQGVSGAAAGGAMTPADRDEAFALLRAPDLLEKIDRDLDALGYVGERTNKILAYLIAVSRKTEQPLGAVIKSSSSAGKTRLMEKVCLLCPPEEVEYFSRISPKALYHLPDDHLNGRLLVLDEAAGANEDVEYCVRQILSRRVLSVAIVQTNPATGRLETIIFTKPANSAYMEATTALDGQNVENENRVFVLALDESEAQTAKIHAAQKNLYRKGAWGDALVRDKIVETHRNAQRLLRPMRVDIPFVEAIHFPVHWLRTRRDHERFLALVASVAFLFQYQRRVQVDASGALYVVASVEDYRVAYDIARSVMAEGLSELTKAHAELLGHIETMVAQYSKESGTRAEDFQFTRATVREYTGWPHYRVRDLMRRLEDLELVQVVVAGHGKVTNYRLGTGRSGKGRDPLSGLTDPQDIGRED